MLFYDGDVPYMTGYAPIFHDGEVVAAVGVEIGAGFVDSIRVFGRSVLIFAGLGALLTVGVAWGLARTLTRPIQRLVEAAREIGRGNMGQEVATASDDEIGYLGETMEEMRRKLVARDAQLRLMLGGVAHEIRNPLGSIELYAGLIAGDLPAKRRAQATHRESHRGSAPAQSRNFRVSRIRPPGAAAAAADGAGTAGGRRGFFVGSRDGEDGYSVRDARSA